MVGLGSIKIVAEIVFDDCYPLSFVPGPCIDLLAFEVLGGFS